MKQFEPFGRYILVERLAAGGMAEVFLARSNGIGNVNKFVAIKRILPQYSDNPEFIEMFKEEARIATNLNHSSIVPIFEFGVEKSQFYLVMEYVEGQNLRQILNQLKKDNKNLTIEQCVYIAKQVAAGLDHAHRCLDSASGKPLNITHRDMSPQNVMISFEGEVKVVDFGIAKAESEMEHTRAGTIKGKFGYMSPEQAEGQTVDSRTDIFSLGIVLWELLARDRLFTAANEAATLKKIRDCNIPPLRKINPAIPAELERIVNKALAKDKSLRYQSCAAMHREINKFMNVQYPDFSLQDFSVFMKSTFSHLYIDNRKKLAEYAKIAAPQPANSGQEDRSSKTLTRITHETTATEAPVDSAASLLPQLPSEIPPGLPPEGVLTDDGENATGSVGSFQLTNTKINLKDLQTKARPIDKFAPKEPDTGMSRTNFPVRNNNPSNAPPRRVNLTNEENGSAFRTLFYLALFALGASYMGFRAGVLPADLLPKELARQIGLQKETPFPLGPQGPSGGDAGAAHTASKGLFTVAIESSPSGAKVYLDGVDSGLTTPASKQLDANQEVKITLKKDGFQDLERIEHVSHDGSVFNYGLLTMPGKATAASSAPPTTVTAPSSNANTAATSVPLHNNKTPNGGNITSPDFSGPAGVLSVIVANASPDTVVFLDNEKLNQRPPIRDRIVPANKLLRIKVVNPSNHQKAEKQVSLFPNERKEVLINLPQGTDRK